MGKYYTDANERIVFSGGSAVVNVIGNSGSETAVFGTGVTGSTDQNIERIDFSGASSAYTFSASGNQVSVLLNGTVVETIAAGGTNQTLVFSNGSAALNMTANVSATAAGGITLGGAAITYAAPVAIGATGTGAAVTPTTINPAIVSTATTTTTPATPTFTVTAGAASVTEGNNATFKVDLSAAQSAATTVTFTLTGTGGTVVGTDTGTMTATGATLSGSTLTFAAGAATATVTVPITFDTTAETGKGISAALSNASTGTTASTTAAVTATPDNTAPTFTLTSNAVAGAANEEGTTVTYTITPSGVTDKAYTFTLSTIGDTVGGVAASAAATAFSPASQTVTFNAGTKTAVTVPQTIVNNNAIDGLRGYKTSLLDSTFAVVSSKTGLITDPSAATGSGTIYTLTTGTDTFPGTSANDTVNAGLVDYQTTANSTLSILDTVTGGAGTDTLNIITQGTTAVTSVLNNATVSGIEVLNVRAISTAGVTLNASNTSGLTTINSNLSTDGLTVTNLATGAVAAMTGNTLVTNGALTFGYATTTDAATLNVIGGTLAGAVAISSAPTAVTFNSTGAANIIGTVNVGASDTGLTVNATTGLTMGAITGAALTTITVTGAAATAATPVTPAANDITSAVQLGALPAAVTTIDASAMTAGGVSATLIVGITSFKGGAGVDTVTSIALTSTTASIIDAGAGTDVLRIGAYTSVNTATLAKQYANFETVDSLALTGTALDMSLFTNSTITALRAGVAASPNFSNVTATQAANITIYGSESGTTTIGVVGASTSGQLDTVKLTIDDGLTAQNTITINSVAAAGVETINVVANDHATISLMTGSTSWTTSTITGAGNVSLTTGAIASNANTTIDASALTGTFTFVGTGTTGNGYKVTGSATKVNTITGTSLADTLIGGTANDTITGGAGNNTLTGGGGADSFVIASSGVLPSATSFHTITDYSKTAGATTFDTISATALIASTQGGTAGSGVATITSSVATFNAADTTFAQHLAAVAAAQGTVAGQTTIWQEGADSYIYITDGTAAVATTDTLIKLVGVTAGSLTISGNAITAMA